MDLIQKELDCVAHEWNVHRIQPNNESPGGIPDCYTIFHKNKVYIKAPCAQDILEMLKYNIPEVLCSISSSVIKHYC